MVSRDAASSVYPEKPTVPVSKGANSCDCPRRFETRGEQKGKDEEKANRNRAELKIP
jgi:hypothetical protein